MNGIFYRDAPEGVLDSVERNYTGVGDERRPRELSPLRMELLQWVRAEATRSPC